MVENASIIREKRKSIKIVLTQSGELVVYAPFGIKIDRIEDVLQNKKNILAKKMQQLRDTNNKYSSIFSREEVMVFGKKYTIVLTDKVRKASFTEEYFLLPKKHEEKVDFYIKKTVREIAERVIFKRVKDILFIHREFEVSKMIIGDFKSKWGSCDNFGVIKFNWRLAMVPPKLVDFVIMHELSHLKELNHSNLFYNELSRLCPNWKESREALKEYSFLLSLY